MLSLGRLNAYSSLLLLFLLGFNLSPYFFHRLSYRIAISGAIGISTLILSSYLFSLTGLKLPVLPYFMLILFVLTFNHKYYKMPPKDEIWELAILGGIIIGILLPRILIFELPCDSVDNIAHAYKIRYILEYNSMFPKRIPTVDMLRYPGGIHALAVWIISVSRDSIPYSLFVIRLVGWFLIPLGTYLFGSIWFNRKIGLYSAAFIQITNMYYYYHLNYIIPNFTSFYFLLVSLSLFRHLVNTASKSINKTLLAIITISGTTFIHPYGYMSYFFISAVYLGIRLLSGDIKTGEVISLIVLYLFLPLFIYFGLNPYVFLGDQRINSKFVVEYGKAGVLTIRKLVVVKYKSPRDVSATLNLMLSWAFKRNNNILATLLMGLGAGTYITKKRSKELLSLGIYFAFVTLLILNRMFWQIPIPYYGSISNIERMFILLTPLFPLLIALGFESFLIIVGNIFRDKLITQKLIAILLVLMLVLIPSKGLAIDLISSEEAYLVGEKELEDFEWIDTHFDNATILNSCYRDSGQWIPFFTDNNVLFSYVINCRLNGLFPISLEHKLLNNSVSLNVTLAYVETNVYNDRALDPLLLYENFRLLRYKNAWIFDLTSNDTSKNEEILKEEVSLCRNYITGNIYVDGKYYAYGILKKDFRIKHLHLKGINYATILGKKAYILFNPCKNYKRVRIKMVHLSSSPKEVTFIINGVTYYKNITNEEKEYVFNVTIEGNKLNIIKIVKKDSAPLAISNITLER